MSCGLGNVLSSFEFIFEQYDYNTMLEGVLDFSSSFASCILVEFSPHCSLSEKSALCSVPSICLCVGPYFPRPLRPFVDLFVSCRQWVTLFSSFVSTCGISASL